MLNQSCNSRDGKQGADLSDIVEEGSGSQDDSKGSAPGGGESMTPLTEIGSLETGRFGEKLRRTLLRLVELTVLVRHLGRNVLRAVGDAHRTGTWEWISRFLKKRSRPFVHKGEA